MADDSMADRMLCSHLLIDSRATLVRALLIAASASFCLAMSGAAHASEKLAALECSSFCVPMNSRQLETYRAEGVTGDRTAAPTQLSVILWDENRRMAAPANPTGPATSPTATPLTITPPTSNPTPVPVLIH